MKRGREVRLDGLSSVNANAGKSGHPQCPTCGSDHPGTRHNIAVTKAGPDPEQRHGYSPIDYRPCTDETFHREAP